MAGGAQATSMAIGLEKRLGYVGMHCAQTVCSISTRLSGSIEVAERKESLSSSGVSIVGFVVAIFSSGFFFVDSGTLPFSPPPFPATRKHERREKEKWE